MRTKLAGLSLILLAILSIAGCTIVQAPPTTRPLPPSAPPPPPAPSYGYDVGLFYDDLDPYGTWFELAPYGYVWAPASVGRDWRPYTVGRWIYTDYGWTWVSDEDFGWAVFHYGRWVHNRRHGWVWVPGTEWGPAWVAWRAGGGYSGWAPLPPEVGWRVGVGLDLGGVDLDLVIASDAWCFVQDPYILEPRVVVRVEPVVRNVTVVRVTKNVTRYTAVDRRVINKGIDVEHVERVVHKPVPRVKVVNADRPTAPGRKLDTSRNEVRLYRPDVEDRRPAKKPRVSAPPAEPGAPAAARQAGPRSSAPDAVQPSPSSVSPEPDDAVPQPGGNSPSMERRQALERQRLEQRQAAERKSLEERQEVERKNPPKDVPKESLAKRQSEERQHLQQRQERERREAEARRAKEKKAPPPPEQNDEAKDDSDGNNGSR
jgi:hypothetical protein